MNRFTDRQKKIIKEIHNSNTFITGKSLSLILNVSLRTIQSEVSAINKVLHLILSTNRGYKIDDNLYKTMDFTAIEKEQNLEHIIVKKVFFHNPFFSQTRLKRGDCFAGTCGSLLFISNVLQRGGGIFPPPLY